MTPSDPAPRAGVLLVDDEEQVRADLGALLESRGFKCYRCASANEARSVVEKLEGARSTSTRPSVFLTACILDMSLNEASSAGDDDGMKALDTIRKAFPRLPVIVRTGHDKFRARAMERGASLYLVKP